MKNLILALLVTLAISTAAFAEQWKNVPMVDTMCASKIKDNPAKHTTECSIKCAKGGFGVITADGTYLKFNKAGNTKGLAALKSTQKVDDLRVTVTGERKGDTIKVKSLSVD